MAYSMKVCGLVLGVALAMGVPAPAQDGGGQMGNGNGFAGAQRVSGTVTAVAGDKLTVKSETGETFQIVTTTNTRVMKDRQPVKVADIPVGSGVGAMGLLDAPTKTVHAMFVMVVDPEQAKKAREGLGKVYILGKVEKIEDTTLTILRSDGVTQKIEVDEGTSFKRGGRGMRMGDGGMGGGPISAANGEAGGRPAESITLLDIKVGDMVGGPGALKNGVFVAKELGVIPPGTGRRRRGADGAAEGAPAASGAGQTPQ